MRTIRLASLQNCMISDEDYNYLKQWLWQLSSYGYVIRVFNGVVIFMHLEIAERMKLEVTDVVDHKDRNLLNCQRSNLRSATHAQNTINRNPKKNRKSLYTGVRPPDKYGTHLVYITNNGHQIFLGGFKNAVEGAKVYDSWAKKIHGEFAVLNFPEDKNE